MKQIRLAVWWALALGGLPSIYNSRAQARERLLNSNSGAYGMWGALELSVESALRAEHCDCALHEERRARSMESARRSSILIQEHLGRSSIIMRRPRIIIIQGRLRCALCNTDRLT